MMIHASGLHKSFLGQAILQDVSLHVEAQESLVILGQSGVGKSVLLKLLAKLLIPDTGTVQLGSLNVGMLFQKNALFDSMSAFENLDFPLRERTSLSEAERTERANRYLDWVGLYSHRELLPHELSGGMQKRLGIARALIVEPEILFYDEPTAGLDPITSRMIVDLILRLSHELKTTLVSVTSDVARAFQMADKIALLVPGDMGSTLIDIGSPEQTRNSPNPSVQQFILGLSRGPLTEKTMDDRLMALDSLSAGDIDVCSF
jgi:phospholipid/cholesterol/gamma-HCH transport system ATP-binding protein